MQQATRKQPGKDRRVPVLVWFGVLLFGLINFYPSASLPVKKYTLYLDKTNNELVAFPAHPLFLKNESHQYQNLTNGFNCKSVPAIFASFLNNPLPVNRVTSEMLTVLPGIGAKKAERIIALRNRLGRITTPESLTQVKGISTKLAAQLEPYLCFD